MTPEDKDLTTFICHRGLFRFKVMPFGLVNAGATFSRIMRKLLDWLSKTRNYLDDVITYRVVYQALGHTRRSNWHNCNNTTNLELICYINPK